jgi:hypothetical protein
MNKRNKEINNKEPILQGRWAHTPLSHQTSLTKHPKIKLCRISKL